MRKIYFLLFLFSAQIFTQEKTPFILDHADELIGKIINGENVRELKGNVSFHQGSLKVKCNYAIQFIMRNELELIGNVKMEDDSLIITSEKANYNSETRTATTNNNVQLINGTSTLNSQFGFYDVEKKQGKFYPNVKIVSKVENAVITGNQAEYDDNLKYFKILSNAKLVQFIEESNSIDTLAIISNTMESTNNELLIAKGNVLLARNKYSSASGEVHFYKKKEEIFYYQKPILWYEENQISGDSIQIKMENNKLQYIIVKRRCFAITPSDSLFKDRYNQMTGQFMKITFANDTIRNIYVENNAVSLYYIFENNEPNGVNIVTGDKFITLFKNGIAESINMKKGVEGVYHPENILLRDKTKGYLDGFKLIKNRPTIDLIINDKSISTLN